MYSVTFTCPKGRTNRANLNKIQVWVNVDGERSTAYLDLRVNPDEFKKAIFSNRSNHISRYCSEVRRKIDAMDEYIRKVKLEQQSSLDDDWVDGQAVCEYLCICDKTLQRLRSAGKITYSTIGNKYYYQIAEIKRCLKAHLIKSNEELLDDLMQNGVYTPRKRRY